MYIKTTSLEHTDYFDTISGRKHQHTPNSKEQLVNIQLHQSDTFLKFEKPVKVMAHDGIALIILTNDPHNPAKYQEFVLQGVIQVKPGICFNVLSITEKASIILSPSQEDKPQLVPATKLLKVKEFKEQISISRVYSFFYSVKTPPYHYPFDQHNYFEMTIVDQGELIQEIDGKEIVSGRHDCTVYFPNQKHSQRVVKDGVTAYVTILFDATGIDDTIKDTVFHLSNHHAQLLEKMIELSNNAKVNYYTDEIILLFKTVLVDMLRGHATSSELPSTSMKENYESELFQSMVDYLRDHVTEQSEVKHLVSHFSLSRSSIQMLFNKYANTTPKHYINRLRLNRSKLMIKESKLSLSEIAHELGYGSIQYFSRVFSKEFGISPSTYAKSIMKK